MSAKIDKDTTKGPGVRKLIVEGAAVCASFALLAYLSDSATPDWQRMFKFMAMWVALSYFFRVMDFEFKDKLGLAVGIQLGTKTFGLLNA